jgi:hypothetical protein
VPLLEEFAKCADDDFHSQQELLALYQAEHAQMLGAEAARRAARRRARLVERPLWRINGLEAQLDKGLTLASPLAAWFAAHRGAATPGRPVHGGPACGPYPLRPAAPVVRHSGLR